MFGFKVSKLIGRIYQLDPIDVNSSCKVKCFDMPILNLRKGGIFKIQSQLKSENIMTAIYWPEQSLAPFMMAKKNCFQIFSEVSSYCH